MVLLLLYGSGPVITSRYVSQRHILAIRAVETMSRNSGTPVSDTFEQVESATQLFRLAPVSDHLTYYTGTLPFILGLLFFQTDMSLNPLAASRLPAAAFFMAAAFIWMKCWQALYLRRMQSRIRRIPLSGLSFRAFLRLCALQIILQPSGFLLIPLSAITVLPFAWVYAFYQNALLCETDAPLNVRRALTSAWRQAAWQPFQNHIILGVYSLFGLFVIINVGSVVFLLPLVLKTFFDIETRFSLSGMQMFNTTFFFIVCGMTYLCMDPLVKITYAVRCFQADAVKTGDDIRTQFTQHGKPARVIGMIGLMTLALSTVPNLSEAANMDTTAGQTPVSAEKLAQSIETVMSRPEFTWRLPREKTHTETEKNGFLTDVLNWMGDGLEHIAAALEKVNDFFKWLQSLFPEADPPDKKQNSRSGFLDPNLMFTFLCILLGLGFSIWVLRKYRARKKDNDAHDVESPRIIPDLSDESIHADALPSDQWLAMAREQMAGGDLRLALRAVYLASLSYLGEQGLISMADYKSNLEYHQELTRRAHDRAELLSLFRQQLSFFEDVWYGMHPVSAGDIDAFRNEHEKLVGIAK